MNKKLFTIFLILLISFDTIPCKNLATFADATITTITSDSESALLSAVSTLNKSGGVIYINTAIINVSSTSTIKLSGSKSGGIVGLKQSSGAYPRISFKNARNKGSTARGFTISGTNQYMKFLTIEHAGDNGIWISGAKNTLDHIITRYNNDSGVQLSDNADSNTLNYCYSYRNIDVKTYSANADGFAPKLGATNTVFKFASLGITVTMDGILMTKKVIIQLVFNIFTLLAGIMVIQKFSLVNMIITLEDLWIKICGLFNNLWNQIHPLNQIIKIKNSVFLMEKLQE